VKPENKATTTAACGASSIRITVAALSSLYGVPENK